MEYQFATISNDFETMAGQVNDLHEKDAEVHRVIFGIDPIDETVWEGGTGGSSSDEYLTTIKNSEEFANKTKKKVENLKYKIQLQKKLFGYDLYLG